MTIDEQEEAISKARDGIKNQVELIRRVAKDCDENEARIAQAMTQLQIAQLAKNVEVLGLLVHNLQQKLSEPPALFRPDGQPIIQ
jgi:hypothetical protein